MTGIVELDRLLAAIDPLLDDGEYVFCTLPGRVADHCELEQLATFREAEGLTLVLPVATAQRAGLVFSGRYRRITLTVHSSLDAVGLTAAVAEALAARGISVNVVAAYYHDHLFVPAARADEALRALQTLRSRVRRVE